MKYFYIKDNVCVPYKLILSKISNFLIANGWISVRKLGEADICIIGCCGAFHSLEDESLSFLAEAKKTTAELIAFGCLIKISPQKISKYKPDKSITASDWERFETLIENPAVPLNKIPETYEFRLKEDYRLYDPKKQFLLIQTGCSANCPHCPHKIGIGDLKSRPSKELIWQVKSLTEKKDIDTLVLHGNDTGSYGTDIEDITFPELIKKILEFPPNLHLSQISTDWAYKYREELFDLLMNESKIKEFQILVQTTSNRLLKIMERKPVVNDLYQYLKKLRLARKDLILRTDIIIGYPTSTEEEDKETLQYVSELFDEIAVHGFELFPNTRMEQLDFDFHSQNEINRRVNFAVDYLKSFQNILVHRGGQVYKTLVDIEKPKDKMRIERAN